MIRFRHYKPNHFTVTSRFGICLDLHPKRKTLDIYFAKHTFALWIGRKYL